MKSELPDSVILLLVDIGAEIYFLKPGKIKPDQLIDINDMVKITGIKERPVDILGTTVSSIKF